jgi:hypothetical protein
MRWARCQVPFDIRGGAPLINRIRAPHIGQFRPLCFRGRLCERRLGSGTGSESRCQSSGKDFASGNIPGHIRNLRIHAWPGISTWTPRLGSVYKQPLSLATWEGSTTNDLSFDLRDLQYHRAFALSTLRMGFPRRLSNRLELAGVFGNRSLIEKHPRSRWVCDIRAEARISGCLGRCGDSRVFRRYRYARFERILGRLAIPSTFVSRTLGQRSSTAVKYGF